MVPIYIYILDYNTVLVTCNNKKMLPLDVLEPDHIHL
jgi:hypothetical protein